MSNQPQLPSPYRRGANDGFPFGLYLVVLFFASIFSSQVALLTLLTLLLFIGVPFVIYYFLRRAYIADYGCTTMSALWMHGIMIFLCGGLIAGAVEIIWLRWIQPDFILDQVNAMIAFYREAGIERSDEMADILQKMVDNHLVPSAIMIVVELLWLGVFTGSLLSALIAILVRARPIPQRP